MFQYFYHRRIKISNDRKTKLIQPNPIVDFLTTEEYIKKNETYFRLYVIHPFQIVNRQTKEKETLKIGDIIDIYKHEIDNLFEPEEWILITFRKNHLFSNPLGENYFSNREDLAEDNYFANLYSLYDCTIPYDYEFYFWMSWKGWELEYKHNKYSYTPSFNISQNIKIAGNILGFIRFSDKIAYKTFRTSLADAIQKYIILTNNEPSYYEEEQAKDSLENIVEDLNNSACEMNIVEPVYKSFEKYIDEKHKEAIEENFQRKEEEEFRKNIQNQKRNVNEKLLEELSYKEKFFSEMKKY